MLDRTKQDPCGERLLAVIVNELRSMLEAGYDVDNYYRLGEKLLNHNYYQEPEDLMNQALRTDDMPLKDLNFLLNLAAAKHTEAFKEKEKDYLTFFTALGLNIEEWCDIDA